MQKNFCHILGQIWASRSFRYRIILYSEMATSSKKLSGCRYHHTLQTKKLLHLFLKTHISWAEIVKSQNQKGIKAV